ncbi:substrate-binding periplasmic protein [Bdellovibrio bacteriovorus]|uniref:substrate-binding periplasmic protein n=1 Tax=Bdellovibrio bacteriovorus TaxID=959 RepID=UPI0035A725CA
MKIYARAALGLLFFVGLGIQVPASHGTKNRSQCERRFSVGLNNYKPLAYRENGRLYGLAHDLIKELEKKTGCEFTEIEMGRPTAAERINNDRVDMLALLVKSTEYEKGGVFVPFYNSHRELTVAAKIFAKNKKIEDYLADENIKFAYMIGNRTVISEEEEKTLLKGARLIGTPDPEGAFRLLKEGRVQALLFSSLVTDYYIRQMSIDKIHRVADTGRKAEVGFYLSARRVSSAEREMFAHALAEIKKDGSFLRIFSKYMSEEQALRRLNN